MRRHHHARRIGHAKIRRRSASRKNSPDPHRRAARPAGCTVPAAAARSRSRRLAVSVKLPIRMPVSGLNATTCAPMTPCPFLVTRPTMPPVSSDGGRPRIQIGDAGDVVGLQHAIGDRAGGQRDRKHHRAANRARDGRRCRCARFRQSPNAQGRADARARAAPPIRDRRGRAGRSAATENTKRVLKKMSASSIAPVVASIMKLVAPSTRSRSGRSRKPIVLRPSMPSAGADVMPWYDKRTIAELDTRPGRRGALDRAAQIHGADAVAVAIGNEIADRLLLPGRIDDAAVQRRAELEVRQRRRRSEREQQRERDRNADASSSSTLLGTT